MAEPLLMRLSVHDPPQCVNLRVATRPSTRAPFREPGRYPILPANRRCGPAASPLSRRWWWRQSACSAACG